MSSPKSSIDFYRALYPSLKKKVITGKLENIPRGNTCKGVNREVIKYLLSLKTDFAGEYFLDLPCGEGEFLKAVHDFFPHSKRVGGDIRLPSGFFSPEFLQVDARRGIDQQNNRKYKVITCISGVMEFDNTLNFFESVKENLEENGSFLLTNDNLLTVRDRLLYLLFGRFRQFKLTIDNHQPTWKILTLQNLLRILHEAEFEVVKIKYIPVRPGEWTWLPFALLIYLFQGLYMAFAEKKTPFPQKSSRYPFTSLLSRHYILVCRRKSSDSKEHTNKNV